MVYPMARKKSGKSRSVAKKKLHASRSNRVFLGVFGGLAEYFEADPMHVRLLWAVIIVAAGLAVGAVAYALVPAVITAVAVAYMVAYLLMTEAPEN